MNENSSKKSKTMKKLEHHQLQKIGESLIDIPDYNLVNFELNEELFEAVTLAKKIKAHGALRRQKQLIGKLMKHQDPEPILNQINILNNDSRVEKEIFKKAEKWREDLLSEKNDALDRYNRLTGIENKTITDLLHQLESANQAQKVVHLKRQLFKIIHKDLVILSKKNMGN